MSTTDIPRRALVTGASSGIGERFAERLAASGTELVVVARRRERLESLATRVEVPVEILVADMGTEGGVHRVSERAARGDVTLLVNNAGWSGYKRFLELDPGEAEGLVWIHVMATVLLSRAVMPAMVKRGSGGIVNVASLLGFSGAMPPGRLPFRATYAASKSFVITFTQQIAAEMQGTGVAAQVLCPGVVETEFHDVTGKLPFRGMDADDVVTASLQALRMGEVVCAPSVEDPATVAAIGAAGEMVFAGGVISQLAERYR
jgi:uncharacterized protein